MWLRRRLGFRLRRGLEAELVIECIEIGRRKLLDALVLDEIIVRIPDLFIQRGVVDELRVFT